MALLPNLAQAAETTLGAAAQSGRYFGAAVAANKLGDSAPAATTASCRTGRVC
ncbi:hypothetical protein [Micromonospora lupini]|uniref:hypothetical protein n=1 Tax=Micromonospora lupini TaxID=285679 RepID=UPI0033E561C9